MLFGGSLRSAIKNLKKTWGKKRPALQNPFVHQVVVVRLLELLLNSDGMFVPVLLFFQFDGFTFLPSQVAAGEGFGRAKNQQLQKPELLRNKTNHWKNFESLAHVGKECIKINKRGRCT